MLIDKEVNLEIYMIPTSRCIYILALLIDSQYILYIYISQYSISSGLSFDLY